MNNLRAMVFNYIKIALRNLRKHSGYSLINIIGLSVGLTCCFVIGLYLNYEFSFEDFHVNKDKIYRVIPRAGEEGATRAQVWNPSGLAPDLREMREVELVTRIASFGTGNVLKLNQRSVGEGRGVMAADSTFFKIFTYPLIQGDENDVLDRPFEMVISKSIRDTYFKGTNPVGKIIEYDGKHDFVISGVMEDMPEHSHISADFVVSFLSLQPVFESMGVLPEGFDILDNYSAWNYPTYALIPDARVDKAFQERMNRFIEDRSGSERGSRNFTLQPLKDIHFEQGIRGDTASGNINFVYAFSATALLVLIIACFNFVNLTTARSLKRAKEVGVRKSLGADKRQLVMQFLGESMVVSIFAILLSLIFTDLLVPVFADIMNSGMTFSAWGDGELLAGLTVTGLLTAILAGFYPAFYLSGFNPINALNNEAEGGGKSTMRKVLTSLQFSIASLLVIGTVTVLQQMNFVQNKDLGFDQSQVIYTRPPQVIVQDNFETFKQNLEKHSFVEHVTRSNNLPGMTNSHWSYEYVTEQGKQERNINTFTIDPEFVDVLDLEIVEGRNITWDRESDLEQGYLLNEAAIRELGLEDPLNTSFRVLAGDREPGRIIGVVKDFHYRSLHRPIEPLAMWYNKEESWMVSIEMQTAGLQQNLEKIEQEWNNMAPDHPFNYTFLNDQFRRQFQADRNFTKLLSGFTVLGIIIACLGLFGLTSFMVEQRTKEIGIRKVLGASVANIVKMLSLDFSKLVMIAFVIVVPVAYLAVGNWLQNFAYRIEQSIWVYLLSGAAILLLAFATVSYRTIRAAYTNPIDVLKDE